MPLSLVYWLSSAFDAHPHPGDAQADQLVDGVRREHVGRAEDVERPGLVVLLHQFQQPQRPLAVQQEVLVHHEERADVQLALELAHDVEQLVAGLVEVDGLALAAEHGRGGAEVAAQRAADRRDHAWRPRRRACRSALTPTLRVPMPERDQRVADRARLRPRPGSGGTSARPRRGRCGRRRCARAGRARWRCARRRRSWRCG